MRKVRKQMMKEGRRRIAVLLAVCLFISGFMEQPFVNVQASGSLYGNVTAGDAFTVTGGDLDVSGGQVPGAVADMALSAAEPVDRTYDTGEIKAEISDFKVEDTEGSQLPVTGKTEGDKIIYDASGLAYYSIKTVSFQLSLEICKDSGRELKGGDYFLYNIPTGFAVGDGTVLGEINFGGIAIAYCTKDGDNLRFTFTDSVNQSNNLFQIAIGANVELSFDHADFSGQDRNVPLLKKFGGDSLAVLLMPEEPGAVDGISKKGIHNGDNTITWTIEIGALSQGILLKGLEVVDILPQGQELKDAYLTDAAGNRMNALEYREENNIITCRITDEIQAPAKLIVISAMQEEELVKALDHDMAVTERNSVKMQAPADGSLKVGENCEAEAGVEVNFKPGLEKQGEQLDSSTIHWTIRVNSDSSNPVHVYKGVVTDKLAQGLTIDRDSIRFSRSSGGTKTPSGNDSADSAWAGGDSYCILEQEGRQVLVFSMAEDTRDSYTIEFNTEIGADFTGQDEDTVIYNEAEVTAQMPYWNGGVMGYRDWDYGIPGAECEFGACMISKEGAGDTQTGIITWTLNPSTRVTGYDSAVLKDIILSEDGKQEYVADSLKVYRKGALYTGDKVNAAYDAGAKKLTVAITPEEGVELGDYSITYQTRAISFFQENDVIRNYRNTAELSVNKGAGKFTDTDNALVTMRNPFLNKATSFEYWDNTGYFHYTITVNGNSMNLTNVQIEDILRADTFTTQDGGSFSAGKYWKVDWDRSKIVTADNHELPGKAVTANGMSYSGSWELTGTAAGDDLTIRSDKGVDISEKQIIHLYVTLNDEGRRMLTADDGIRNERIFSNNTIKGGSSEIGSADGELLSRTSGNSQGTCLDNTMVKKSQAAGSGKDNSAITWQVVMNANGGNVGNAVIEDSIPKSLKYTGDVKLYEADYADGTKQILKGKEVRLPDGAARFDVTQDSRTMTVDLGNVDRAYILEYTTSIVYKKGTVKNSAVLTVSGKDYGGGEASVNLNGGNWGTLLSIGALEITKYDASVGAAMPLKGAEISVYSDEGCTNRVDIGVTDEQGKVVFYGLDVPADNNDGQTYYIKETKVPEGYQILTEEFPKLVMRGAPANPDTYTMYNYRQEMGAGQNVELVKQFRDSEGGLAAGQQSEFKLYFYPYGKTNQNKRYEVKVTEDAPGNYVFASMAYQGSAGSGGISVIRNSPSDGRIIFTGMPWGYYGLEEINPAGGFAAYKGMLFFEISRNPDTGFEVEYYFSSDLSDNKIVNESTVMYVKKVDGNGNYLPGARLQIGVKAADGTVVPVNDPLTGQPYEWTAQPSEQAAGHRIDNLPADGNYVLREVETPDKTYALAEDISFKMDRYGRVNSSNTITVTNRKITLQVQKKDQFGEAVEGAVLQMTGPAAGPDGAVEDNGYDKSGQTSASGAAMEFSDLVRGGSYLIRETVTPDGYDTVEDTHIRVAQDGRSIYLVAADGEVRITGSLTLTDRQQVVPLKIRKADSEDTSGNLEGARFQLSGKETWDQDYELLLDDSKITTGADGWHLGDQKGVNPWTGRPWSRGLANGFYCLKETAAPEGYCITGEVYFQVEQGVLSLTDEAGKPVLPDNAFTEGSRPETITITDTRQSLKLKKTDFAGRELEGAGFKLTGRFAQAEGDFIEMTADAMGVISVPSGELVSGIIYKLEETAAPAGYCRMKTVYFIMSGNGDVAVTDEAGKAVTRKDVQAENVSGAVLTLKDEKTAAEFVKRSSEDNNVRIDKAEFVIKGIFADDLSRKTEKTLKPTATEAARLEGLLIEGNSYTLTEKAPEGYLVLDGEVTFSYNHNDGLVLTGSDYDGRVKVYHPQVDPGCTVPTMEITNTKIRSGITLRKSAAGTAAGVEGVCFDLYRKTGGAEGYLKSEMTDEGGNLTFLNLEQGTYVIRENIENADSSSDTAGIYMTEKEYTVTITAGDHGKVVKADRTELTEGTGEVENEVFEAGLTLTKLDRENGDKLPGAVFELEYKAFGSSQWSIVQTGLADEDGDGTYQADLGQKGSYRITELTPPSGYVQDGSLPFMCTFEVCNEDYKQIIVINKEAAQSGRIQVVNGEELLTDKGLDNVRRTGSITLTKQDEGGKNLAGVTFTLFRKNDGNWLDKVWNFLTGKQYSVVDNLEGAVLEEDGKLTVTGLPWGEYKIVETAALPGYKLDKKEYPFTIGRSGTDFYFDVTINNGVSITNSPNKLIVEKRDKETGKLLEGAVFSVENTREPEDSFTVTTGQDGTGVLAGKLTGGESYRLHEVTAPEGYHLNPDSEDIVFTMEENGSVTVNGETAVNETLKITNVATHLQFSKYGLYNEECLDTALGAADPEDTRPLAGVEFAACTLSSPNDAVAAAVSDEQGWVSFKALPKGVYVIRETKAAPGYELDSRVYYAVVDNQVLDGDASIGLSLDPEGSRKLEENTWINDVYRTDLLLKKVSEDKTDEVSEGAVYGLYKGQGEERLIAKAATDKKGELKFTGILMDTQYTIRELENPFGSYLSGNAVEITYEWDETDGNARVKAFEGGNDGDGSATAEVTQQGHIIWLEPVVMVEVSKTDADGNLIEGAWLRLKDSKGSMIEEWVSQTDSHILRRSLCAGQVYTLEEVKAPKGYTVAEPVVFSIPDEPVGPGEAKTVQVVMSNAQTRLILGKREQGTDLSLNGAVFTLTNAENEDETYSLTVSGGDLEFAGELIAGDTYILHEEEPPAGYIRNSRDIRLTLDYDGTVMVNEEAMDDNTVIVENEPVEVSFRKLGRLPIESCSDPSISGAPDPEGTEALEGVEFSFSRLTEDGEAPAGKAVSDPAGMVTIRKLPAGEYVVRETGALKGYAPDTNNYYFEVTWDGAGEIMDSDADPIVDNSIINDVYRTSIKLKKVNEQNLLEPVPGSSYGLFKKKSDIALFTDVASTMSGPQPVAAAAFGGYGSAGFWAQISDRDPVWQLIAVTVTDGEGLLEFPGVLMDTEYMVRELIAPYGSYVSANPIYLSFQADESGMITVASSDNGNSTADVNEETGEITWREPPVEVEFFKVDENGNLLTGAMLQVEDADGNVVEAWTSDASEPYLSSGKIAAGGEYYLVEAKAPEGYYLAEPVAFTVTAEPVGPNENMVIRVVMTDQKKPVYSEDDADEKTEGTAGGAQEAPRSPLTWDNSVFNPEEKDGFLTGGESKAQQGIPLKAGIMMLATGILAGILLRRKKKK